MKNANIIQILAARARGEESPQVDVTGRVMTILAEQTEPPAVSERLMMWLAAVSSAVAVPTAALAVVVYYTWTNPLREVLQEISWVLQ